MYPFKAVFQYFFLRGCLVRELRSYLRPLVQVQGPGVGQVVSWHGETLTRPMTHHDPSPKSNCTQAAERYGHPLVGSCYHYDPSGGPHPSASIGSMIGSSFACLLSHLFAYMQSNDLLNGSSIRKVQQIWAMDGHRVQCPMALDGFRT